MIEMLVSPELSRSTTELALVGSSGNSVEGTLRFLPIISLYVCVLLTHPPVTRRVFGSLSDV